MHSAAISPEINAQTALLATRQTRHTKSLQNVDNKIAINILPSNDSINSIFIASGEKAGLSSTVKTDKKIH